MDMVLGVPDLLPAESRYTVSAQRWANAEVCRQVLERLERFLPDANVQIGIADVKAPQVEFKTASGSSEERLAKALARTVLEAAIKDVRQGIDRATAVPIDLTITRELQVEEIKLNDRIVEYRLALDDLAPGQCQALIDRGWSVSGPDAATSMPVDAFEREREWLIEHEII
jgi:hypothetical protein